MKNAKRCGDRIPASVKTKLLELLVQRQIAGGDRNTNVTTEASAPRPARTEGVRNTNASKHAAHNWVTTLIKNVKVAVIESRSLSKNVTPKDSAHQRQNAGGDRNTNVTKRGEHTTSGMYEMRAARKRETKMRLTTGSQR